MKGPLGEPQACRKRSAGDAYLETECPKGQMGFYVAVTEPRFRAGSFVRVLSQTWLSHPNSAEVAPIADVPAVIGSLDVVMGEIDR